MTKFDQIKKYFNMGIYKAEQLDIFVQAGDITKEQKDEILKSKE